MKYKIKIDKERDYLLTIAGKAMLKDRYLLKNESFQDLFARVASYYADDTEHAQRLYDYISNLWFMPATPILSNGGTNRGLPISCFLNECDDSLQGIVDLWYENVWLASGGGGIGSYWGNVRSLSETVGQNGNSSGIIPFLKVQDSMTLAISQGSLRRGSAAVYLPIDHPEIEEFIELRRPTGGDIHRRCMNIHHGVCISDDFMEKVRLGEKWDLKSPKDGKVIESLNARDLWIRILTARLETGEPYLLFIDNVNKASPEIYKKNQLKVKSSNLCNEIMLHTGKDRFGKNRTAVCCLSSVNLEYFSSWKDNALFIPDIYRFLDNVLEDFIKKAPTHMEKAKYSATRERSVGLGVMGLHRLLQKCHIPFESAEAVQLNGEIFQHIDKKAKAASKELAIEKGACPDAVEVGLMERFAHYSAIAPTASISTICGGTSPGIEPFAANSFVQKNLSGSFPIRNKYLEILLEKKNKNTEAIWGSIAAEGGSVQHLSCLTDHEKAVYRTAYEIDQTAILAMAAERGAYITQGQSLNLFCPADIEKSILHKLHFSAWEKGLKGLYYMRSQSLQRPERVGKEYSEPESHDTQIECLSCQ